MAYREAGRHKYEFYFLSSNAKYYIWSIFNDLVLKFTGDVESEEVQFPDSVDLFPYFEVIKCFRNFTIN